MVLLPLRVRTRINTAQKYYKYVIIKNRALTAQSYFIPQQAHKPHLIIYLITFSIKDKKH